MAGLAGAIAAALSVVPGARAAAPPDGDPAGVVLVLVGLDEADAGAELVARLSELLWDSSGSAAASGQAAVRRAPRFEPERLFAVDGADAGHPTAWVVLDGATARVRTADAQRERFLFRDLAVARPLTELDRERIGQTVKAALATVVAAGNSAGVLGPGPARAAAGLDPSARAATGPAPSVDAKGAPERARDGAVATGSAIAPSTSPLALGLAGYLEFARVRSHFAYGPGIVGTAEVIVQPIRIGPWLSLMTFLPSGIGADSPAAPYGVAFRCGLTGGPSAVPWIHLELGAGYDWVRPLYTGGGEQKLPIYRLGARLGPVALASLKVASTLFVEHASRSFDSYAAVERPETRPGLTIELWWR